MSIETVDKSLYRGLVKVTKIGSGLAGFLAKHEKLGRNESEGVDDDFAFDGLDGIDDYGDGTGSQLLEGLLGVNVDGR